MDNIGDTTGCTLSKEGRGRTGRMLVGDVREREREPNRRGDGCGALPSTRSSGVSRRQTTIWLVVVFLALFFKAYGAQRAVC